MARLRKDDLPLTCLGQLPLSRVQLSCGLCFYSLSRPDSSTRWKNRDFWKVLGGVIPPVDLPAGIAFCVACGDWLVLVKGKRCI